MGMIVVVVVVMVTVVVKLLAASLLCGIIGLGDIMSARLKRMPRVIVSHSELRFGAKLLVFVRMERLWGPTRLSPAAALVGDAGDLGG
jgi:hypothetical protein